MKSLFSNQTWIILGASLALLGLGLIQINWILQARQLKQEQIHHQLKQLSDEIAIALEIDTGFTEHKIIDGQEPIPLDKVSETIESIFEKSGVNETAHYAVFQEKKKGIYRSDTADFEQELRSSPYKTCLSCIMTIRYLKDSLSAPNPEMTFIRTVSEMEKLGKPKAEFLWFSFIIPNQEKLTDEAIWGLFILTVFLMVLLVGLFAYVLNSLSKQKKLNQVKDDFFNNMTHEFKTPLGSILLASKVLRKKSSEEKRTSYLDLIENESKKLESQVDKILQLSMLESNQIRFAREKMDLHSVIEKVTKRLKLIIEQKEAKVYLELKINDSKILGDEEHISNAIYNLVENALKYSGKNPKITISTFEKDGQKIISVKDYGIGIPKEHQAEIFDRFYRAQTNNQYKGNGFGIGLSYVKTVIEAHNGTIHLNENYTQGCEFLIRF